jgi:DNA-binding Lrp family transcriptional regulator
VAALDQHIRSYDHASVGRRDHGGVVTGAEDRACGRCRSQAGRDPRDQGELADVADALPDTDGRLLCASMVGLGGRGAAYPATRFSLRASLRALLVRHIPGPRSLARVIHRSRGREPKMVQAYILIQTEVGRAADVVREIAGLDGVANADDVTGPYDVIVRAEAETVDELGKFVVARIQQVKGITRTLTCPVVHL